MTEYKTKKNNFFLKIIFCVFSLWLLYVLWQGVLSDIIPHSKQRFLSYNSFRTQTERVAFCNELPESANEAQYYIYEGGLNDKACYRTTLAFEDYQAVKTERIEFYKMFKNSSGWYCYESGHKIYADLQQMETRGIDFLDNIMPEEDVHMFYLLTSYMYSDDEKYSYMGVLCNDETCEMIEFGFYGPMGSDEE